jgi:hypothetical protein
VEEERPPRRVAGISGFHRRHDESFMLKLHWVRGSLAVCVRGLRRMVPWWGSSGCCSGLQRAVSFGVAHCW